MEKLQKKLITREQLSALEPTPVQLLSQQRTATAEQNPRRSAATAPRRPAATPLTIDLHREQPSCPRQAAGADCAIYRLRRSSYREGGAGLGHPRTDQIRGGGDHSRITGVLWRHAPAQRG